MEADAIVAFMFKDYKSVEHTGASEYIEGIRFYARDGSEVTNYPKDHIRNGIDKNNHTNYDYKKLVRIFKQIRNVMVDEGKINGDKISSFLVECLIWNVPDATITSYSTWTERVKQAIVFIYSAIDDENHSDWGEVSERLYLFYKGRKWTGSDAKDFMHKAWDYLECANESN